jgi:NADPH2:quinone reductase
MRAVVLSDFGATAGPADVPIPEPGAGEVRVRVHASSVNGFDVAVANSHLNGMMEHRFPVVLGKDFAGTVDAVGPDVTGYEVGDRVFGVVTKPYLGDGGFAEYVTVATAVGIAKLPSRIEFADGGVLGLAGVAAINAVDKANIQPGQVVLVAGATGGVGNQALQLAVKAGATVIATAATADEKRLVTDLGATETVDCKEPIAPAVHANYPDGVDVVLHFAGDAGAALAAVRKGGTFVSTLIMSAEHLPSPDVTVLGLYANPDEATLNRVANNHAEGVTRVHIERTYSLDEVPYALAAFAAGTLGKLAIAVA